MIERMIENDWNDEERRKYERYSLTFYLSVYDTETDALLGQVIDISPGGMKLLSEEPIPVDKQFRLLLDVSLESGKKGKVFIEAQSIWSYEDDNPGFSATGFQFSNLSQEIDQFIQNIAEELGADIST
jgi:c-di-GMP-binding flagellar brake protein YcgR